MTTATAAPFASPLTLPTITPELFAPPTNKPPAELAITRVLARLEAERRDLGRDVISFGGGLPSPRTFDVRNYERHARAYFKHIAQRAQQGDIAAPTDPYKVWQSVLNYTDTRAQWWIRNDFAEAHSRDMGFRIDPNRLVPTQGNTQGIHALLQYYNQLGVPVAIFCERQAYTGMLTAAKQMPNLKIFSVDMDEDGMKPEHLIARQREAMAKGFIPGMIYLVPDGGNPSGITISQQRRDDLYRQNLELARETGKIAYFFEDSPYYLIRVGSANTAYPKPMAANDPAGVVIYAFSASKIGYPGKRVGWLHLPMAWCSTDAEGHNLTLHAEATAQIAATVLLHSSEALAEFNGQMFAPRTGAFVGLWPRSKVNSAIYRANMQMLYGGLATALAQPHPELFKLSLMPSNGFVITLAFPGLASRTRFTNTSELATHLLEDSDVIVTPMAGFAPDDIPPGSLDEIVRFTFSATPPERIDEGVERFVRGVKLAYNLP